MLTQDQLKKLEKLTKDRKYGPLLKAAIVGWKKYKVANGVWGVRMGLKGKYKRAEYTEGCCLLGAALIGREVKSESRMIDIEKRFKLSFNEIGIIMSAFDGNCNSENNASKFAEKVRKIVLP